MKKTQSLNSNINYFTNQYVLKASLRKYEWGQAILTVNVVILENQSHKANTGEYQVILSSTNLPENISKIFHELQNVVKCLNNRSLHEVKIETSQIFLIYYVLVGNIKKQQRTSISLSKLTKRSLMPELTILNTQNAISKLQKGQAQSQTKIQNLTRLITYCQNDNEESITKIREQFLQSNLTFINCSSSQEGHINCNERLTNLQKKAEKMDNNIKLILNILGDLKRESQNKKQNYEKRGRQKIQSQVNYKRRGRQKIQSQVKNLKCTKSKRKQQKLKQQANKSSQHSQKCQKYQSQNQSQESSISQITYYSLMMMKKKVSQDNLKTIKPVLLENHLFQILPENKIKYNQKKNGFWGKYILKNNAFQLQGNQYISFIIKIVESKNKKINFGIIDPSYDQMYHGKCVIKQRPILALAYSFQSGLVIPNNPDKTPKYKVESLIQMRVNPKLRNIIWIIDNDKVIDGKWELLETKFEKLAPFVQMCRGGDTIQWI